ncbi:MAG TPA: MBL fold metallo-hydrolase [Microthrixaceae bacterium]|nr:MBL fold metallo-hydrolase [Microthrixaceae bacterium]
MEVPGTRGSTLNVTFYGVRGSTPCACDDNRRYGGNTACVVLESPGRDPILFDLGTGLRFYGLTQPSDGTFRGSALVSHLHWDHVQGIPFFTPILAEGARLDVYAPPQEGRTLAETVRSFLSPPYFPVEIDALPGCFTFHEMGDGPIDIGGAKVTAAPVPHVGPTVGYRVECDGISVVYISDHQQPGPGATEVSREVLDLCEGADLLIHDAQYDHEEFAARPDWGHCTYDYAVEVAARAGVRRLVLFHHDPAHCDDRIDQILEQATAHAARRGIEEVLAAAEGLTISYGSSPQN